nr:LRR receptor-like serine/threonine-protein kinase RPK2 [Tanacetum cinerariifolium]
MAAEPLERHPLLSRPLQSGDLGSTHLSRGTSYHSSESLSGWNVILAPSNMFDAPVLPHNHVHSSVPPTPLGDNSVDILGVSTGSMAGSSVLRILQTLNSFTLVNGVTESQLGQGSLSAVVVNVNVGDPPLPLRTQRSLPLSRLSLFSVISFKKTVRFYSKIMLVQQKVPLEGFKALQRISGPRQRFQIHTAYKAPEWLPSAHTCINQLDLPEYKLKEQLQERLLLAIHKVSKGFGFG